MVCCVVTHCCYTILDWFAIIVLCVLMSFLLGPGATVGNFTVEVTSATSVELSWVPPDPHLWNGVITNYTVSYQLLGPVGMAQTRYTEAVSTMNIAIPSQGNPLTNNANPLLVVRPVQWESAVVDDLQEYSVYTFSVFIANSAGRSQMSQPIMQEMPGAG